MKLPSPASPSVPELTARVTTNGGLSAETSSRERTVTNSLKGRSSRRSPHVWAYQLGSFGSA